jgi:hypothetical protein
MSNLLQLFDQGAQIVGIKDDIEAIIGVLELVKKVEAGGLPDDAPSLDALLDLLADGSDSDNVKKVFGDLGLEPVRAKIAGLLAKVKAAGAEVPKWVKTLATRLDKFGAADAGSLSWTLLNKDIKVPVSGPLTLGFSGSFALACAASTDWDEMSDAGQLMQIGLAASLGAKADATIPANAVTLKASGNAAAKLDVNYYFQNADGADLYGAALVKRAVQIPDPFSYAGTREAFGHPGFMGSAYAFTASAGASFEVSLGKLIDASEGLKVDLSAKVSVAADIKHQYVMTLRRGPDVDGHPTILAAMSVADSDSKSLGVSVGVTIDLPVLRAKVQELIKDALAEWDGDLAKIREFLSPGTYLQGLIGAQISDSANKLVGDPDLKAALIKDLQGIFGINTTNDLALAGWLKTAISGAVAQRSAALIKTPEAVVKGVLDDIEARIPQSARPLFEKEVAKIVAAAKAGLDGEVQKLWTAYANKTGPLGKILGEAGRGVKDAVTGLDQAFEGVRQLLDACNKLVQDVAAKASAAIEKKISIALHAQAKQSRELQVKFSGAFNSDGGDAPDIFREMAHGDLAALADRIRNNVATPPTGFKLDGVSQVSLTETDEFDAGYEIVLFGFGASGAEKITASATAILDADGNVQIDTKGELEKRFKGGGEERVVSFADVLSIAIGAAAAKDVRPSVTSAVKLGVVLSYHDDKYSAKKLDGFLDDLESDKVKFIDPAKGAKARALLASWIGSGGGNVDAEVSAKLWFDKDTARKMLRVERIAQDGNTAGMQRSKEGKLTSGTKREIIEIGLAALDGMGVVKRAKVETAYGNFRRNNANQFPMDDPAPKDFAGGVLYFNLALMQTRYPQGKELQDEDLRSFAKLNRSLHGLIDIIDLAGQAYLSPPPSLEGAPAKWTLKTYREFQRQIVAGSRYWLRLNQELLFFTKDGINPTTLAFMIALERLAGDLEYPVALSLTNYAKPDSPDTVPL